MPNTFRRILPFDAPIDPVNTGVEFAPTKLDVPLTADELSADETATRGKFVRRWYRREGMSYHIGANGTVRKTWKDGDRQVYGGPLDAEQAKEIRDRSAKLRAKNKAKGAYRAMRDLGMKRYEHGWE